MAKLIERFGSQTLVEGKQIDLGTLVNAGAEIINIFYPYHGSREYSKKEAEGEAIRIAQEYGCSYVMLGKNSPGLKSGGDLEYLIFIATFFNDKK